MIRDLLNSLLRNTYFFGPFFLWIVIGGLMLFGFSRDELFFAVNSFHSPFLDQLNTVFSAYGRGDVILILLCSLLLIPAFRNWNYVITSVSFGILAPLTITLAKQYFETPRPLKFYGDGLVHTVVWLGNAYNNSFPSGHTIGAFGYFLLMSLYLPVDQKKWSLFFFVLALVCGISRMALGQHFFSDVYAGSLIGTLLSLIIFTIVQRFFPTSQKSSL